MKNAEEENYDIFQSINTNNKMNNKQNTLKKNNIINNIQILILIIEIILLK
jgi:hypothetical protein